jgi:H2-forming N5,N10-methylenetetrahydromethanopterin dehydrogenase-like enzyme
MSILNELREQAGLGGPAAALANELLVIHENYSNGELTSEEYGFLLQEIADIRAQQELATDEIACRWIVAAAQVLMQGM